jgi:hypothetical protein
MPLPFSFWRARSPIIRGRANRGHCVVRLSGGEEALAAYQKGRCPPGDVRGCVARVTEQADVSRQVPIHQPSRQLVLFGQELSPYRLDDPTVGTVNSIY